MQRSQGWCHKDKYEIPALQVMFRGKEMQFTWFTSLLLFSSGQKSSPAVSNSSSLPCCSTLVTTANLPFLLFFSSHPLNRTGLTRFNRKGQKRRERKEKIRKKQQLVVKITIRFCLNPRISPNYFLTTLMLPSSLLLLMLTVRPGY